MANAGGIKARHHVEHTGRNASAFRKNRHRKRRKRGKLGRTCHKRTSGGQCWRDLACDHCVGEIPRGDRPDNADGLFQHDNPFVWLVTGDGVAVDALGLFCEPFDERGAVHNLALGFGQWLAHFRGQDRRKVIGIGDHQIVPFAQDRCAFLARHCGPADLRIIGGIDGGGHVVGGQVSDFGNNITGCRVGDDELVFRFDPFAIHIGLTRKQCLIGKLTHLCLLRCGD